MVLSTIFFPKQASTCLGTPRFSDSSLAKEGTLRKGSTKHTQLNQEGMF